MTKILSVFGTRPEAIKMSPLIKALEREKQFDARVCVTGQHKQMLEQVTSLFAIRTNYNLDIMKPNQRLSDVTSGILFGLDNLFHDFRPDLVLVHGDTATTFATALSAYQNRIKIGHVEAGLRTGNLYSPWPEEGNRKLVGALADYHFAPTEQSALNLINEGVNKNKIVVTGNTVIDSLFMIVRKIESDELLQQQLLSQFQFLNFSKKIVLVTGHRRENFGESFVNICNAIRKLSLKYSDVQFVYPVHLNPNVRRPVAEILSGLRNVFLIEPLEYIAFAFLMQKSYLILTDSGGIQEEAPSLGKPVLVMRDTTERPEAVAAGTVILVGSSSDRIEREVSSLLEDKEKYNLMSAAHNPYGDGLASNRIVDYLKKELI